MTIRAMRKALLVLLIGLSACAATDQTRHLAGYQHYLIGNAADVVKPTNGLWVLQGGGDDVDENYVRMGARGGGGDFVVLRASQAGEYNQYIYDLCKCDSVETIVFDDRVAASDPFVIQTIRNAEALFIAGGDQDRYVRFWKGTPVQDAINFVAAKPAPIGGTSAGMAILGEFVYSSMYESLTSAVALADPYAHDVTLEKEFLALPRTGRDSHRPAPSGARSDRPHGDPARPADAGRLVVGATGDRGRPRNCGAYRSQEMAQRRCSPLPLIRRRMSIF